MCRRPSLPYKPLLLVDEPTGGRDQSTRVGMGEGLVTGVQGRTRTVVETFLLEWVSC